MLTVTNLSIRTKQTKETLVRSVSFSVKNGEALGLIGESGSGKSMTSKCIMRLLNPRLFDLRGSVQWNGKDMLAMKLNELDGYRGKQVSMIPQNPMTAFAPMLKLGKQMELGFSLKGHRERTQFRGRLAAALADVNLSDAEKIINSYPHELSGGTLQRVMIALTILQRPELIIADEITTAVDAASEYLILNELEKLRRAGVSMIVVTHDFGVAARLCDRVAVMKDGEIVEEGKMREVFSDPQHEYTRQLVQASVLFQEGTMLKAEHITKQYQIPGGGHTVFDAVSDVSIELGNGGVTAIVGESGSGKSTLARVLSYVERPDGGRVFLDGLEVSACGRKELRAVRGKVQLVMQNALGSLDPHQSVVSILEEPLRLLFHMGAEERKQRCLELLDMARLERDTLRHRPGELSGGQQKRLCIARALAAQPQHIIFDESFSGLDVTLKKQVLDFLKELQTELQISFLVITHDLDTAMYMAGTIHVMRRGKIIETLEHPKSFSDFQEPYSQELVKAVRSKRRALQ